MHRRLDEAINVPGWFRDVVREYVDRSVEFAVQVAKTSEREVHCREAASNLYHAATAALLTWEGGRIYAMRGDARRILFARLVVEHELRPRDPLVSGDARVESRIADLLLADAPVSMADAVELTPM